MVQVDAAEAAGKAVIILNPSLIDVPSSGGMMGVRYLHLLLAVSINQSITFPALWLGVSKEIVYFCPPSLSILSQPCPRWQDPKGIQILSDIISPALHWPAPASLLFNAAE